MQRIDHTLPWSHLGTERRLSVFRYGHGPRKVYIQASLHADELPGMRTAWELKQRLNALEAQGLLKGVIELVPVANPIGLDQHLQSAHMGRFELGSGKNFNRSFVELSVPVGQRVGDRLGDDPAANITLIRQTMLQVLDELPAPLRSSKPCIVSCCAMPAMPISPSTCTAISRRRFICMPCRNNGRSGAPWPRG